MQRNPFKHHRFPPDVILSAVRWYCRFSLSYRDVRDLLAKRNIEVRPPQPGTVFKDSPSATAIRHCWRR